MFFFKQKTAYEMRISDCSSDVCSSDLLAVTDLVLPRERGGFTVDHVSLTLGAGEIVGIYGLLGAGRTELLESIMGCRRDATGSIRIAGAEISDRDVSDRMAAGVALEIGRAHV